MKGINTKDRLLEVGLDQVSVGGLAGVTLGRLADASGLSKSGLFAHFRSKEQLQLELLAQVEPHAERNIFDPARRASPGLPRLRVFVERWFGWPARAGLNGGCPIAAALFELDDAEEDGVRERVRELEAQWRAVLAEFVSEAVAEGHLRADTDVEQFVWELCGIYLFHHVASRFVRTPKAGARAKTAWEALIQRHAPSQDPAQSLNKA